MSHQGPSSSNKKQPTTHKPRNRRRKVADDIQEKHPESVKNLLAALEKAQKGSSSVIEIPTTTSSTKQEKKQTVGAKLARNRNTSSGYHETPSSSRQRASNSVSAGPSKGQVFVNSNYSSNRPTAFKPLPTKSRVPKDVLDDLIFRFIEHIPEHEKIVNTRVCFQVELAHWFYVDYYVNKELSSRTDCPNMQMREFAWSIFSHSVDHKHMAKAIDEVLDEWRHYKSNVPTYGAILLDKTLTKVVLVQGYYSNKNSWGFPKGKVNENEDPRNCAAREVFEETGFDFKTISAGKEPKIQKFIGDTMVRLYIIKDVPIDYNFAPKTRNEIRDIQWFTVADLPTDKNDQINNPGPLSNFNFYTVIPFVQDLQNFVKKETTKRVKAAKALHVNSINVAQAQKITPTDMLNSLSQVNMDQASMTPGQSITTPNILSNLFNAFINVSQLSPKPPAQPIPPVFSNLNTPVVKPMTTLKAKTGNIASANSAFSPFKPVEENIAQSLLNIVKPAASSSKSSPKIAHPIPIPGRPKLDGELHNQRPTPPKQKIGSSDGSAFKVIPKNKSSNSLKDSDAGSVFGSELALDKLGARDSIHSTSADLTFEGFCSIQLCDVWKSFKLDTSAIIDSQPYSVY